MLLISTLHVAEQSDMFALEVEILTTAENSTPASAATKNSSTKQPSTTTPRGKCPWDLLKLRLCYYEYQPTAVTHLDE